VIIFPYLERASILYKCKGKKKLRIENLFKNCNCTTNKESIVLESNVGRIKASCENFPRIFFILKGVYEEINKVIEYYLTADTVSQLYERILDRLEKVRNFQ
jgi:hypothetical protein